MPLGLCRCDDGDDHDLDRHDGDNCDEDHIDDGHVEHKDSAFKITNTMVTMKLMTTC